MERIHRSSGVQVPPSRQLDLSARFLTKYPEHFVLHRTKKALPGLAFLVQVALNKKLDKDQSTSDWASETLTDEQQRCTCAYFFRSDLSVSSRFFQTHHSMS